MAVAEPRANPSAAPFPFAPPLFLFYLTSLVSLLQHTLTGMFPIPILLFITFVSKTRAGTGE